jgi:hypothetical protein
LVNGRWVLNNPRIKDCNSVSEYHAGSFLLGRLFEELLDHRLVWNEARFCFVQDRDKNLGGNSLFRSADRIATEKRRLKRKWKAHIRFEDYKSQERVAIQAPRRQSLSIP